MYGRQFDITPDHETRTLQKRGLEQAHVLRASDTNATEPQYHSCGGQQYPEVHTHEPFIPVTPEKRAHLVKRADVGSPKFVELLLANDFTRIQQYGEDLEKNTMQLANIAASKYLQASDGFGRRVFVSVSGIYNAQSPLWVAQDTTTVEAGALLIDFAQWRSRLIGKTKGVLGQNDAAILLTGRDLVGKDGSNSITGLSNVGQICSDDLSAGVSEGRVGGSIMASQGNTLAHELGHILNLPHDGEGLAQECPNKGSVMQAIGCSNCESESEVKFSECSIALVNQYFARGGGQCLDNPPLRQYYCGNGIVESNMGEECDPGKDGDDACCDATTCRFRLSGITCLANARNPLKRLAGTCDGKGSCQPTCGNGRLDENEQCDASVDSQAGCCDKQTCTFKPQGDACDKGKCDADGVCKAPDLKTLSMASVRVDERSHLKSYHVSVDTNLAVNGASNAVSDSRVFFSLDGTLPYERSPDATEYQGDFDITLPQILTFADNFASRKVRRSVNPFVADNDGTIKLYVVVKAYHPNFMSSIISNTTLEFNLNTLEENKEKPLLVSDGTNGNKNAAVSATFGTLFGVLGLGFMAAFLRYRTRDDDEKKEWRDKARKYQQRAVGTLRSMATVGWWKETGLVVYQGTQQLVQQVRDHAQRSVPTKKTERSETGSSGPFQTTYRTSRLSLASFKLANSRRGEEQVPIPAPPKMIERSSPKPRANMVMMGGDTHPVRRRSLMAGSPPPQSLDRSVVAASNGFSLPPPPSSPPLREKVDMDDQYQVVEGARRGSDWSDARDFANYIGSMFAPIVEQTSASAQTKEDSRSIDDEQEEADIGDSFYEDSYREGSSNQSPSIVVVEDDASSRTVSDVEYEDSSENSLTPHPSPSSSHPPMSPLRNLALGSASPASLDATTALPPALDTNSSPVVSEPSDTYYSPATTSPGSFSSYSAHAMLSVASPLPPTIADRRRSRAQGDIHRQLRNTSLDYNY